MQIFKNMFVCVCVDVSTDKLKIQYAVQPHKENYSFSFVSFIYLQHII